MQDSVGTQKTRLTLPSIILFFLRDQASCPIAPEHLGEKDLTGGE